MGADPCALVEAATNANIFKYLYSQSDPQLDGLLGNSLTWPRTLLKTTWWTPGKVLANAMVHIEGGSLLLEMVR